MAIDNDRCPAGQDDDHVLIRMSKQHFNPWPLSSSQSKSLEAYKIKFLLLVAVFVVKFYCVRFDAGVFLISDTFRAVSWHATVVLVNL